MNLHNKKRDLLKSVIVILIVTICVVCFLHYLNRQRSLNVLLITLDALRADHLSCYGYKRNTSPNIDKFSKEGVLFTQAIAQSSHTAISMASIATSTYLHKHLLVGWGHQIKSNFETIANILKSKGYKTIFVGGAKNLLTGLHGFNKGFDIFYAEDMDADIVTNKTLEYFKKDINKPFFVWIHYMDTHAPYNPKLYDKLYIGDGLYDIHKKFPIVKDTFYGYGYGYNGIPEVLTQEKGEDDRDNPDYYIANYDGAIRNVDEQIDILLRRMKELNLDKDTLVIITSDHGEMLGERGYYFHHGYFLYEPLIKIPLVMRCYKVIPQNKVIAEQVSAHIDIAPTILDILKIHKSKEMEGVSLLPIMLGKKRHPPYIFADEGYTSRCIRTEEWVLIYNNHDHKYELYNLKSDPLEFNNLVDTEREKFNFLKQKLSEYRQLEFKHNITSPVLDEKTKNKLESLGYLQ